MPNWQPDWTDVQFDHGAAAAYAAACDDAAAGLHRWIAGREAAARQAVRDWEGPHRVSFDHQLAGLHEEARAAAITLLDQARQIEEASVAASREQLRRLDNRQRWLREQAQEAEQARLEAERLAAEQAQQAAPAGKAA